MTSFESDSTWRQPTLGPSSRQRSDLIEALAQKICGLSPGRLRVAVDGFTAAGKTTFGHELALEVRRRGRPTLRASFDDFKKPWRDAREKGYDRVSGDGYYRNAPDFESARELLLKPAGPNGSGLVALCAHDPLTGIDHRLTVVQAPSNSVLIVDSVFALRPEYGEFWDYRIWLDIDPRTAIERGIERDEALEGRQKAEHLHRDRYHAAERIYVAEVDPVSVADVVIDHTDFASPRVLSRRSVTDWPRPR